MAKIVRSVARVDTWSYHALSTDQAREWIKHLDAANQELFRKGALRDYIGNCSNEVHARELLHFLIPKWLDWMPEVLTELVSNNFLQRFPGSARILFDLYPEFASSFVAEDLLISVAQRGDLVYVRLMLLHKVAVNTYPRTPAPALLVAIQAKKVHVAAALLSSGAIFYDSFSDDMANCILDNGQQIHEVLISSHQQTFVHFKVTAALTIEEFDCRLRSWTVLAATDQRFTRARGSWSETEAAATKFYIRTGTHLLTTAFSTWKVVCKEQVYHAPSFVAAFKVATDKYLSLFLLSAKWGGALTEANAALNDPIKITLINLQFLQSVAMLACHHLNNAKGVAKYAKMLEFGPSADLDLLGFDAWSIWSKTNIVAGSEKPAHSKSKAAAAKKAQGSTTSASSSSPFSLSPSGVSSSSSKKVESTAASSTIVAEANRRSAPPAKSTGAASTSSNAKQHQPIKSKPTPQEAVQSSAAQAVAPQKQQKRPASPPPPYVPSSSSAPSPVPTSSLASPASASSSSAQQRSAGNHVEARISLPECAICMDRMPDHAVSCGHTFCGECASSMQSCAVCRKPVTAVIRLFFL